MPDDKTIHVSGNLERITFHNPDNGYTVARLRGDQDGELITVVGLMPGIAEGQEVEVQGASLIHPKFGPQVDVKSWTMRMPSQEDGIKRYLASGLVKGVGPVLAERIVERFGQEALEIITSDPGELSKVKGVSRKKALAISRAVGEHGQLREAMVFLQRYGVGQGTAMRIFRQYKGDTMRILQEEPHRMAAEVGGVGFATADKIAARLGVAHDSPGRLQAGILYCLGQALDAGHVFLPREKLLAEAGALLGVPEKALQNQLDLLMAQDRLTFDFEDAIYLPEMRALEQSAAAHLVRLARTGGLLPLARAEKALQWVAGELSFQPSPSQSKALLDLLTHGLNVLTGGPGTGKTTLVRSLITVAQRMGSQVKLAAPTGRAAKRLSESCGLPAMTLHRLLEYSPKEHRFGFHQDRPLEADLLVVDESSMLDTWLFAHLLSALGDGCRLVLAGDADQLPSVGAGLVFQQVIDSGAARVARLTEIFRQAEASPIVRAAHAVNLGERPDFASNQAGEFGFIACQDPEEASRALCRLVCQDLPRRLGLNPREDVQVLSPMHRGRMGCANLNAALRHELNPGAGQGRLAVGDKVMQVRNNYDLDVFNGDVGQLRALDDDGATLALPDRMVEYSRPELDDLTLAYAITIHKSQGSEYPAVVIALAGEHFIMLNRNLLYTAITRGKRAVIIVGSPKALARAVAHHEPAQRHAALDRRIRAF